MTNGLAPLRSPDFGSYQSEEVAWLVKDLSGVALEASIEDRERDLQAGRKHYSESLPVEYQPSIEYQDLYSRALQQHSRRVALALGTLSELVVAQRQHVPIVVSLARAGTPIGLLMRRWFAAFHGQAPPHYTMSIIRGRGLDVAAMRYLAAHHEPERVLFVDGWTGKGAIARELAKSVAAANRELTAAFAHDLAVLADPGECVSLYGTREDFLIPSACLNSTVSGLVSRTVLNKDVIGPGEFHGAKFYSELAGRDVSREFVDTVSGHYDAVHSEAVQNARELSAADRSPTWAGWRSIEAIVREYDLGDVNLAKPGVGETTRVLLRRVPWRVLISPGAGSDVAHILRLAEERGVPIEVVDGLPYTCVGLIHPQFSKGAVGPDGFSARNTDA